MDTNLAESINTFGHSPKADFPVSPAEPSITVPAGLLQDLLGAVQGLKEEVAQLREERDQDRQEIAALRARIAAVESLEEQDVTRLACDIAQDRRRLAVLERPVKEPRKTELGRAEKIEKYIAARPDHEASYETLKGMLQVDNVRLNDAIKTLMATSERAYSIQRERTGDKRKRILVMLPR